MDFSLVFATRSRADLLDGLFQSLRDTTCNHDSIEIFPVYDSDDIDTKNAIPHLLSKFNNFSINFIERERSIRLNEDYINHAARMSTGKFVFVLNDDTLFQTKCWDRIADSKLEAYLIDKPDRIVYGITDDSMQKLRISQNLKYSGFPIVSREAVNVLGYAMHPLFNSWGADIHLFNVYNLIGRTCDVEDVRVFHLSPHMQSRKNDAIDKHVQNICNSPPEYAMNYTEEANRVRDFLGLPRIAKSAVAMMNDSGRVPAPPIPDKIKKLQEKTKRIGSRSSVIKKNPPSTADKPMQKNNNMQPPVAPTPPSSTVSSAAMEKYRQRVQALNRFGQPRDQKGR